MREASIALYYDTRYNEAFEKYSYEKRELIVCN